MNRAFKIVLLSALAVVVAIFALGWWAFQSCNEIEVHAARVDWLPATASDISSCWIKTNAFDVAHVYEFHIGKGDFESLARERKWPVKPIVAPQEIIRYLDFLPAGHPAAKEPGRVTSRAGLYYRYSQNNGGGTTVVYDEASSTAYVDWSAR
ncbi:hypothetical protein [Haloferula sp. BvORR071]|uniref:hypothetical protein n=1 Tax=Haloferula sp. BvORR071 TaxID=1396141 RepID=UPI000555D292|nr:hypothetical protein [Haloferula sp. BvORR071]